MSQNCNSIDIWRELKGLKNGDLLFYLNFYNERETHERESLWLVTKIVDDRSSFYALGNFKYNDCLREYHFHGLDFEAFRRIN